jgi:YD repeat-containing protein
VQTRSTASQLRTRLAYDAVGRLETIASFRADASPRPQLSYSEYDDAGNRKKMESGQEATTYAYDALHRLVTEDVDPVAGPPDPADAVHYDYDRAGNRLHAGQQDAGGQWSVSVPHQVFSYELDGEPICELPPCSQDSGRVLQCRKEESRHRREHDGCCALRR